MIKLFNSEPVEVEGLGTLNPLTLAQMTDLHAAICKQMIDFASVELSGAERATAASAIALNVGNLSSSEQVKAIIYSPFLLAMAAGMMLGKREWISGPMLAAQKIPPSCSPGIQKAVVQSYGLQWGDAEDGSENPPKAVGELQSSESPESSPPSTVGHSTTSAA